MKTKQTGAALVAMTAELAALAPLRNWPPVHERVQAVITAMSGHDGLSEAEVLDLRLACARWKRIAPNVREFYCAHAHVDETTSTVLWHLLFRPEPGFLHGFRLGHLRRLWLDYYGEPASAELYPRSMRAIR